MPKSLADLRRERPTSLPTRVVKVCLDQAVLAEVQRLEAEKNELLIQAQMQRSDDPDAGGPPKRMVPRESPRVAEINTELAAQYATMRESEGELLLRAVSGGRWMRWKDDHPAREDNTSDELIAYGYCNAADLLDSLSDFVAEWNGEPLAADDWTWLSEQIAPADLRELCQQVVEMHETRVTIPKSPSASSGEETSATG